VLSNVHHDSSGLSSTGLVSVSSFLDVEFLDETLTTHIALLV
jgi:hypothetical protein